MLVPCKEQLERDKRSLTVLLIWLNVVLAGVFLLICSLSS